jgi:hypothetical protein
MGLRSVAARPALAGALVLLLAGCGGSSPVSPGGTVSAVQVGVSGAAPTALAPGDTRQLFATASRRDGTVVDVTNLATWQSSNPSIATVSASGLLVAAAEGSIDLFATYSDVRGTLHADIRRTVCDLTISPASSPFGPFGGAGSVSVTVASQTCRWTARSAAGWFLFAFDPGKPGDGAFTYTLPPNSTPERRSATIIVESSTGQQALHVIDEDRPAGCSYVTQPAELTFTASGGTGQFTVTTSPGDCQWTAVSTLSNLGVFITSGFSGRGNGTVRYTVQAHTRSVDADGFIEIAGLSGLNPNGRHRVVTLKR